LRHHFAEINKKWRIDPSSYIKQEGKFTFQGLHKPFKYYNAENVNLLIHRDVLIENNDSMNYHFLYHFLMDELSNMFKKLEG